MASLPFMLQAGRLAGTLCDGLGDLGDGPPKTGREQGGHADLENKAMGQGRDYGWTWILPGSLGIGPWRDADIR